MILMFAGLSQAAPPDIQNHWAGKQINDWVEKGYISGYPDGSFKPDTSVTRAEFITMVNSSFGKSAVGRVDYPDVLAADWFAVEVARAAAAGYISGYDDGSFRPNENIKRQEAAVIIAKLLNLAVSSDAGVLNRFADYAAIAQWSKGYTGAVVAAGYMSGYPDQTYRPEGYITRAEAVSTLDRALAAAVGTATYDKPGTYGPADGVKTVDGNVSISAAGVTLQNTIITGNLFFAESIGDGDVTLKNVIVQGNTVIKGGGSHSVTLENCSMPNITVGKEGVRVVASGNTSINIVRLETGATLVEMSLSGPGFETVTVTEIAPAGAKISLEGDFTNVNVSAGNVNLNIAGGFVANMEIAKTAAGATVDIAVGAGVGVITLDAAVSVTGRGIIDTAKVNVSGTKFETKPVSIDKKDGIEVTTNNNGGGGGTQNGEITISNILPTNTLGKFKFDTDTVTTIGALQGKIKADGIAAISIDRRNSGDDGKVWNAFIAATPYENDKIYKISCDSPFKISGNDTVMWPGSAAATAAVNVTASVIGSSGNGSDLEVSFDSQKGQNTRVGSYRVLVVKSANVAGFNLSDANSAAYYTTVDKVVDKENYIKRLSADAQDANGSAIAGGVSYQVFVLSIADGVNATENALSAPSGAVTLSSGGSGSGGDSGGITAPVFVGAEVTKQGDVSITFNKDMADPAGKEAQFTVKVDGAEAAVASVELTNTASKIKLVMAAKITSGQVVTVAYAKGADDASRVKSGDGGVLETFTEQPVANNTPVAAPVFVGAEVTKQGDVSITFNKDMADPASKEAQFTVKVDGAEVAVASVELTNTASKIKLVMAAKITSGQVVTVAYAKGADDASRVKSGDGGVLETFTEQPVANNTPVAAPVFVGAEVTKQGDVSITFNKDMADPASKEAQFIVKVDGAEAAVTSVELTNTASKIKLVMAAKITSGQVVTVAYTKGADEASQVQAADGGLLKTFAEQPVTNTR